MQMGSEIHIDMYDDRLEVYSPGGMMDGRLIQQLNPLTVPSKRRNPLLADFFTYGETRQQNEEDHKHI